MYNFYENLEYLRGVNVGTPLFKLRSTLEDANVDQNIISILAKKKAKFLAYSSWSVCFKADNFVYSIIADTVDPSRQVYINCPNTKFIAPFEMISKNKVWSLYKLPFYKVYDHNEYLNKTQLEIYNKLTAINSCGNLINNPLPKLPKEVSLSVKLVITTAIQLGVCRVEGDFRLCNIGWIGSVSMLFDCFYMTN